MVPCECKCTGAGGSTAKLRALKTKRAQIKSQCTRFRTYLDNLNVPEVSLIELRQRQQKFTESWQAFNDIQSSIEEIEISEDHQESHQEERMIFETRYCSIVVKLETLIEEKQDARRPVNEIAIDGSRQSAIGSQRGNITNDCLKLPRINLLEFTGKYDVWIPFKNIFTTMIHDLPTLPKVQKMQYLTAALKGEARDVISSFVTADDGYDEAWQTLKERYDDNSLIIQKHIKAMFEQPAMAKENHLALRKLLDNVVKHLRALKGLKRPIEHWDDLIIYLLTSKLDTVTSKEWETSIKRGATPRLSELTDFLAQRCRALEASSRTHQKFAASTNQSKFEKGRSMQTTSFSNATTLVSVEQRIKEARTRKLCLNCLKAAAHQAKQCTSGSCQKCKGWYNTLLHLEQTSKESEEPVSRGDVSKGKETVVATSVNHSTLTQERQVLLAMAIVNGIDKQGIPRPQRALLDGGSQSLFITTECVKSLGIRQKPTLIPIMGLDGTSTQARSLAKVTLQSTINGFQTTLDCLVIDRIAQALPSKHIDLGELLIPEGITLADPNFSHSSNIDLLIGVEIFLDLLCIGKIKLAEDQLVWQKTLLGWIVSGNFMAKNRYVRSTRCNLAIDTQLNENMARFWQLEHNLRQNARTPEERICEKHFMDTYTRNEQGRFIVILPTKNEQIQNLRNSREIAMQQFRRLEHRLERKPHIKKEYTEFMREYMRLGHMRKLLSWGARPHYYLPHHCVIKEASSTTRLRVVFNASSKTTTGVSLNDILMTGPVVQQDLLSILIRFCIFKVAFVADISKMYRQVLIHESQVPLQRIVWREHSDNEIETYELLTLTYGTASASFLATKTIQHLAELRKNNYPKGAAIVIRDFYVDDLISGANTIEEAKLICAEVNDLLQEGGFTLHKWASNDQEVLSGISTSSTSSHTLELHKGETTTTLGVKWNPSKDVFQYEINLDFSKEYTKRSMLSNIASLFDPLGLLAPVIIKAKIMIQRIQELNGLKISRVVVDKTSDLKFSLHGFCDASELAYGACVYLRTHSFQGIWRSHLMCAKSRVAPVKIISIPRIELCGSQLLVQLMSKIKGALEIPVEEVCYWTDSSIVFYWIKASNKKLPIFVTHRIGEIQELTAVEEWQHVGTKENPADLHDEIATHPCIANINEEYQVEDNEAKMMASLKSDNPFNKFFTYNRLIRVTATCLRFASLCKGKMERGHHDPLSVDELELAKERLIKREQRMAFAEELKSLKMGETVSNKSAVKHLSPILDGHGLMRVGGRLHNSELQYSAKHPILILHRFKFTELVIEHEHKRVLHAGAEATLAAVRLEYWSTRARGAIRRLIHRCITCFKSRPRIPEQIMGNLPMCRVTPFCLFTSTGVDFCGSIYVRDGRRGSKKIKAYVAVFVCMTTKAVHLKMVSELTTEAFLGAFKRFVARRGKPADVFSDNGTNFIGARHGNDLSKFASIFGVDGHRSIYFSCRDAPSGISKAKSNFV
ncbi:uncharacterized protein LOC105833274 [Monomorium pharaonis]|uniref:uncharacterized protein LOC105833274 n=1 Tax=Monomorium pharaonis TaxID=307658 RepID=UPI00174616AB|nr:uncharacterized protein LOC105833274 [Monomorium pharaonis]